MEVLRTAVPKLINTYLSGTLRTVYRNPTFLILLCKRGSSSLRVLWWHLCLHTYHVGIVLAGQSNSLLVVFLSARLSLFLHGKPADLRAPDETGCNYLPGLP